MGLSLFGACPHRALCTFLSLCSHPRAQEMGADTSRASHSSRKEYPCAWKDISVSTLSSLSGRVAASELTHLSLLSL